MKTLLIISGAALLSLGDAPLFAQGGSLTPPPGAPTPTMKSLDQIQPRTPISLITTPGDADSIYKIVQPGSYYLTGNLTGVSGKRGIEIAVPANGPGVTIDLMGFELTGVPGSLEGIKADVASEKNTSIRNGTTRNWGGSGIDVSNSQNNVLCELRVLGNGGYGIYTGAAAIRDCVAQSNAFDGIEALSGSTVEHCVARNNAGSGILVAFGTVSDCTAHSNGGDGFFLDSSCAARHCTAYANGSDGIHLGSNNTVTDCTVASNAGDGIDGAVGNDKIADCICNQNGGDGIRVGPTSLILNNHCDNNGNLDGSNPRSGIFTAAANSRIEGNQTVHNAIGVNVDGVGNLIIRNTSRIDQIPFDIVPGNSSGTIFNVSAGTTVGDNVGAWANLHY